MTPADTNPIDDRPSIDTPGQQIPPANAKTTEGSVSPLEPTTHLMPDSTATHTPDTISGQDHQASDMASPVATVDPHDFSEHLHPPGATYDDEDDDFEDHRAGATDHPHDADPATRDDPVVTGRNGWMIKSSTAALYEKRVARLWRETAADARARPSAHHLNIDEAAVQVTPIDVVTRLIDRFSPANGQAALTISSWLAYRSALLWDFSRHPDKSNYVAALQTLEAYRLPHQEMREARRIERRTRTAKNRISREHLSALINELASTKARGANWGARVQHWLLAGMATGLRPNEWEFTKWADPERTLLLAPNSKLKADTPATIRDRIAAQANSTLGEPRHTATLPSMRAIPVDERDRIYVDKHLQNIANSGMDFRDYYEVARKLLWRTCKSIWGDKHTYSLYVVRHQFSATHKLLDTSPDEIARLMGHSNTRAHTRHYAKARTSIHAGGASQRQAHTQAQQASATDSPSSADTSSASDTGASEAPADSTPSSAPSTPSNG